MRQYNCRAMDGETKYTGRCWEKFGFVVECRFCVGGVCGIICSRFCRVFFSGCPERMRVLLVVVVKIGRTL